MDKPTGTVLIPHEPSTSVPTTSPACETTPLQHSPKPSGEILIEEERIISEAKIPSPESISNPLIEAVVLPNLDSGPILTRIYSPPSEDKSLELADDPSLVVERSSTTSMQPLSEDTLEDAQRETKDYSGSLQLGQAMEEPPAEVSKDKEPESLDIVTDEEIKPQVHMAELGIKGDPITVPEFPVCQPSAPSEKGIEPGVHCIQAPNRHC